MIEPALRDDDLLEDIADASRNDDGLRLWWLGQSGFLVQWNRRHLLFDPYLSESLTRKYAQTDKPHVRLTQCPVAPERLTMIDVVTSSHNHTDHLDGETLRPLMQANPELVVVVPSANLSFAAERLRTQESMLRSVDAGESLQVAGFSLHAVPAAHEALDTDARGRHLYLGYVVRCGPWTLYHSGDTVRYERMAELLSPWNIDVAMLPINGSLPSRRVAGNLWGREAAHLARDIGAKMTIPCHYDMFAFNTVTTEEFVETAEQLEIGFRLLKCGERCEFNEPG